MISRLSPCLLLLLALSACSDSDKKTVSSDAPADATEQPTPTSKNRDFQVVETFDVGNSVYVRSMGLDRQRGRLWIGTSVGAIEVDVATRDMVATYTRDHGLANEYIFTIMAAQDGTKWFGTNGGGVSRLRDGAWQTFMPMHGLADYWVYAFTEDHNGDVWIGTWAGLNVFHPKDGTFKTYLKELVNEWVYGLAVDSKNQVWIGTEGGINMFDGKTWHTWTHENGLGAANKDNLPVSANTGLGTRSRHDLSVMMQGLPTYNPNYVFTVQLTPGDGVWAGTWGGGAAFFDGANWTNYSTHDGLAGNIVYSVAVVDDTRVWFGTNNGLSYFDGKQWQSMTRDDGLLDDNVYAISVADDGGVWVGTRGGVALVKHK